jgi:hypothetical protein
MKMVLGGGEENEDHIMITEQDIVSNASPWVNPCIYPTKF